MSAERYIGEAGYQQRREDEQKNSGLVRADAQEVRRDIEGRVPYGRALDLEHLAVLCDEGNQTNRGLVMRRLLLAEIRKNLPAAVLITRDELEQLRADSLEHPTRPGPCPKVPEWPAGR